MFATARVVKLIGMTGAIWCGRGKTPKATARSKEWGAGFHFALCKGLWCSHFVSVSLLTWAPAYMVEGTACKHNMVSMNYADFMTIFTQRHQRHSSWDLMNPLGHSISLATFQSALTTQKCTLRIRFAETLVDILTCKRAAGADLLLLHHKREKKKRGTSDAKMFNPAGNRLPSIYPAGV